MRGRNDEMKRIFRRECFLKKEGNFSGEEGGNFSGEREWSFSGKPNGIFMHRNEYLCKTGEGSA